LAICVIQQTEGHSYISSPPTRSGQASTMTGCRTGDGGTCAVCDAKASTASSSPTVIQRGQVLDIHWARNNHPGGFVRFAWAQTVDSDNYASFDAGVQFYMCFENPPTQCLPLPGTADDANDNTGLTQTACGTTVTVPGWLTDGKWTLQWAWFGGFSVLGDYYSCVDYQVTGGPSTSYMTPYFFGGDRANPGSTTQCLFRNANELRVCATEPCYSGTFPAGIAQLGAPLDTNAVAVPIGAASSTPGPNPSGSLTGNSNSSSVNARTPCKTSADCKSGVCEIDGYCLVKSSSSGLTAGGVAAIVFALLVVVMAVMVAGFFYVNKKEVPYMFPFKRGGK